MCSVAQGQLLVDISRATLNDLVENFLRFELGYGEEIVVNHGDALLYDVEETDNLAKKLSELGMYSPFYKHNNSNILQALRATASLPSLMRMMRTPE